MRTFPKLLICVGAIGGALAAAAFAVRMRSTDERVVAPVEKVLKLEVVAQKTPREYPAFGNIQHVLTRLRSALVAAELKLTPEQLEALRAADDSYELLNRRLPEIMERASEKGGTLAQFQASLAHDKQVAERLVQVLQILQPDQKRRLHEIMCQTYGLQIFDIDEIADSLRLSKEQYELIAKTSARVSFEHWQLIKAAGMDTPQQVTAERERIDRECDLQEQRLVDQALKTIVAEFNDDQKAAYARLVGAPINVATVLEQWLPQSDLARRDANRADDMQSGPVSAVPTITTR